jgi:copper(I)-binding protein
MPVPTRLSCLVFLACLAGATARAADIDIDNAWARATAPGQPVGAGFMDLTARRDLSLIGARSPASQSVELHTMSMAGGVMSMRQVDKIDLPKGKSVSLKPGGLHIMFIGLNAPLRADATTPLTLLWRDRQGKAGETRVDLAVRGMAEPPGHGHP